jgi:hypothetical protein
VPRLFDPVLDGAAAELFAGWVRVVPDLDGRLGDGRGRRVDARKRLLPADHLPPLVERVQHDAVGAELADRCDLYPPSKVFDPVVRDRRGISGQPRPDARKFPVREPAIRDLDGTAEHRIQLAPGVEGGGWTGPAG